MIGHIAFAVTLLVVGARAAGVVAGLPYIANYASSYNAHVINHDVRFPVNSLIQNAAIIQQAPIQPVLRYNENLVVSQPLEFPHPVQRVSQPIINELVQPVVPVTQTFRARASQEITNPTPAIIPGRLAQIRDFQQPRLISAERNPSAGIQRQSEPARIENEANENRRSNERQAVPNPIVLGTQFLARTRLQPTPVPNGFVFSSRSVDVEQNQKEEQRNVPLVRTAQVQILGNFAQDQIQSGQLRKTESKETNSNDSMEGRTVKPETQPSRPTPNIYSRLITF